MIFEIEVTSQAEADLEMHRRAGNKKILIKINKLLDELRKHPASGTGRPKKLKYYEVETWS